MRAVGIALIALGVIASPVVLEALFSGDGRIEETAIRLILWIVAPILIAIGAIQLLRPDHLRKNFAAYSIALVTLCFSLGLAECALRLVKAEGPREYQVKSAEFEYDVVLNEHGFRDGPFVREKNRRRIFLLGDSYIFGSGVEAKDNIDRLMEQRLSGADVWNLGLPGTDPPEYLETARRFADMHPDAVVVNVYVDNDIPLEGGHRGGGGLALMRLLQNAKLGDCSYDWIEAYDLEPKYRDMACKGEINPWLLPRAKGAGDNQQYYDRIAERFERDPRTKESLLGIRDLFPKKRFLLVLHPSKYQVGTEHFAELRKIGFVFEKDVPVDRGIQDRITTWAHSQKIETLDLLPALFSDAFYTYDDHYTPKGCAIAAEEISKMLTQER